jgi:hypothetical protein
MSVTSLTRLLVNVNLTEGALHDLLLLDFPDGFGNSKLDFAVTDLASADAADSYRFSRKVFGLQKLAQLYLKVLFTTRGSDPLRPSFGTTVFAAITRVNIPSASVLETLLRTDIRDAETQVRSMTQGGANSDEILSSVSIVELSVGDSAISMILYLLSESGEGIALHAPVPLLDMPLNIV